MSALILAADGICVDFDVPLGLFRSPAKLKAVADVSLAVHRGETLGIVGESGSGKSTLAGTLLNLVRPTRGTVRLEAVPVRQISRREFARRIQPVFQDPYSSLNPYRTVANIVAQPLLIHSIGDGVSRRRSVEQVLDRVGLSRRLADSRPDELSGGQRQRVAIARALIIEPDILICDEPTSALDVSVQAQILNLLLDLQRDLKLTYVIVSHNLAVIEHMATHVAVMYCGRVVEAGMASEFFKSPRHPYSASLLDSILMPEPNSHIPEGLPGQPPNPLALPAGCAFASRCPNVMARCRESRPVLRRDHLDREVECHLFAGESQIRLGGAGFG